MICNLNLIRNVYLIIISDDYDNWRHGIESANMKGETRDNGYGVHVSCDTDTCGNR